MGFLKRLAYRPELSSLAGLLRIRLLARWCYFRFVAPRGIMKVRYEASRPGFASRPPAKSEPSKERPWEGKLRGGKGMSWKV